MKHFTHEQLDAWLDGQGNAFQRWRVARHLARCPACQAVREACESDRAFLGELRQNFAAHEAVVQALPVTRVVAPSVFRKPLQQP